MEKKFAQKIVKKTCGLSCICFNWRTNIEKLKRKRELFIKIVHIFVIFRIMKALKLKPIFFPNDDILVRPPHFIIGDEEISIDKSKNNTISSTDQLITILRGRQLKKQDNTKALISEEAEEQVKKLSDWRKNAESPTSPLLRKFTFKRLMTSRTNSEVKSQNRQMLPTQVTLPPKITPLQSLVTTVQGIVAVEKFKKKVLDAEVQGVSERNKAHEANVKLRIAKLTQETRELKNYIKESSGKLEKCTKEYSELVKKHEEDVLTLGLKEAQELMFADKGKKKVIKPGDESQYFIKKEKIRQMKQDLHQKFHTDKENFSEQIDRIKRSLEISESHRLQSKKELKIYREEIVMLYCRILKDGKDIRSDGLRWVIKALWGMKEYIPISAFPKFFDDESSHFLLLHSEKDLEYENLVKRLENMRKEVKNKRNSSSITTARELYKTVRSRLRNISQSSIGQLFDGSTPLNDTSMSFCQTQSKDTPSNYNEIKEIRDKLAEISEFIKEKTTQEIKRVTENYQINPGEAGKVGLFHVIKSLVGEKVREFNKYTRGSVNKSNKNRKSVW